MGYHTFHNLIFRQFSGLCDFDISRQYIVYSRLFAFVSIPIFVLSVLVDCDCYNKIYYIYNVYIFTTFTIKRKHTKEYDLHWYDIYIYIYIYMYILQGKVAHNPPKLWLSNGITNIAGNQAKEIHTGNRSVSLVMPNGIENIAGK